MASFDVVVTGISCAYTIVFGNDRNNEYNRTIPAIRQDFFAIFIGVSLVKE